MALSRATHLLLQPCREFLCTPGAVLSFAIDLLTSATYLLAHCAHARDVVPDEGNSDPFLEFRVRSYANALVLDTTLQLGEEWSNGRLGQPNKLREARRHALSTETRTS